MNKQPIALEAIRKRLRMLAHWKLIAFSASCCECLVPHYAVFVKRFGCGDVVPLRMALDHVWDQLGGGSISRSEYEALEKRCTEVAPEPEEFAEPDRSCVVRARGAADAIRETFGGSAQRSREKASRAARLALDAVALRLHAPGTGTELGTRVLPGETQALRELCNHLDVITMLETIETLSPSFLAGLRASVRVEEARDRGSDCEQGRAKPAR